MPLVAVSRTDDAEEGVGGGSQASPRGLSLSGKIHPVYAIDVCQFTTSGNCRWNNDAVWTSLHVWLEEDEQ